LEKEKGGIPPRAETITRVDPKVVITTAKGTASRKVRKSARVASFGANKHIEMCLDHHAHKNKQTDLNNTL